jgi:hypothetical protein
MRRSPSSAAHWTRVARVDTRSRWIIGLLLALVIGLAVALIIVAAGDSDNSGNGGTTANPATEKLTEPTTTSAPTTSTTTPSGGTPVPGGTTSAPGGGSGGL